MFKQFLNRLMAGFRNFMTGRYGTDKLGLTLLVASLVFSLISAFLGASIWNLMVSTISYALMFWAIFRMSSRNIYARYDENRLFLRFFDQPKDREHRYFVCLKCRPTVRLPRGKGKIAITRLLFRERFIKKT